MATPPIPPPSPLATSTKRRLGRLQLVAHRGSACFSYFGANQYGRTDTRVDNRGQVRTGPFPASDVRLIYCNWYDGGETDVTNALSLDASLELGDGSAYVPANFAGSKGGTMPAAAQAYMSDPLPITLAADSIYFARTSLGIAQSAYLIPTLFVGGASQGGAFTGDNGFLSSNASGQAYAKGAINTTGSAYTNANIGIMPAAIIGRPTQPYPAVMILGDSIANGSGDLTGDSAGNIGFIQRGLKNVPIYGGTYQLPWYNASRGALYLSDLSFAGRYRRFAYMPYCTHAVIEAATNDIAGGNTLAQVQAAAQTIWAICRQAGLHITHVKTMPRTTSTDSWATAANQTPVSGFAVGGVRDQFNAWLDTQLAAGTIDALIDPNPVVEDQANPGKWVTNGTANYPTTDGIHPATALHVLAAARVRTWASGLTV